jgi:hypothetical protein
MGGWRSGSAAPLHKRSEFFPQFSPSGLSWTEPKSKLIDFVLRDWTGQIRTQKKVLGLVFGGDTLNPKQTQKLNYFPHYLDRLQSNFEILGHRRELDI